MEFKKPEHIADRSYENESVVYNLCEREIYLLEGVSSDIWSLIPDEDCIGFDDILKSLLDIYEIDSETLKYDLVDYINELINNGMLMRNDDIGLPKTHPLIKDDIGHARQEEDIEGLITNRMASSNQLFATMIEVTRKCNERCVHCYAIKESNKLCTDEMSTNEITSVIDQLADMGCLYLIFTGGEVFYRKDMMAIFKHARRRRFVIDIYTNGLLIKPNISKDIKKLMPRAVYLSIYSMNSVIHDGVTMIKGSLKKTINAIRLLRNEGISVVINITVFTENKDEYSEVVDFANSVGAAYRISFDISSTSDGDNKTLKYRIKDRSTIFELLEFSGFGVNSEMPKFDPEKPVCSAGAASLSISSTGDVFPCISLRRSMGNIRTSMIDFMWRESKTRKDITSIKWKDRKGCMSCEHHDYCSPCMGISDLEHGDIYSGNCGDCFNSQCKHEFFDRAQSMSDACISTQPSK